MIALDMELWNIGTLPATKDTARAFLTSEENPLILGIKIKGENKREGE